MDEKERERQKSFPALSVLSSIFSTILNEVFHSDKRSGLVWMGTRAVPRYFLFQFKFSGVQLIISALFLD